VRQLDVAVDGPALLELQRAAHAVEAELPGDDRIPPLRESLAELGSAELTWLAVDRGGTLVRCCRGCG